MQNAPKALEYACATKMVSIGTLAQSETVSMYRFQVPNLKAVLIKFTN